MYSVEPDVVQVGSVWLRCGLERKYYNNHRPEFQKDKLYKNSLHNLALYKLEKIPHYNP